MNFGEYVLYKPIIPLPEGFNTLYISSNVISIFGV